MRNIVALEADGKIDETFVLFDFGVSRLFSSKIRYKLLFSNDKQYLTSSL